MANVKKLVGVFPETVTVLSEVINFDAEGIAKVSERAAAVFRQIPGYNVYPDKKLPETTEEVAEEKLPETTEVPQPKKASPRRAAGKVRG